MKDSPLAVFRMTRREIAVAIFEGTQLDYTETHQLPSSSGKAEDSAVGFVRRIKESLEIRLVALEKVSARGQAPRRLYALTISVLRAEGVPVWEVETTELFQAFGIPPIKTRHQLRRIVLTIWPILETEFQSNLLVDAVALGLFIQTERLLTNSN